MEILRYKFNADRNRTLWAELLIRRVVAKKLSRPFEKILIRRDERGKPFVADCLLAISLSHGGDWAVAAVADSAIGIDVEIDSEDALLIAENFFLPKEYRRLQNLPSPEREKQFLKYWTLKESYLKFTGEGFVGDLANIDCEKLIRDETLGGKNFILSDGAIVGVCTQRLKLPTTCTEEESIEQIELKVLPFGGRQSKRQT